MRLIDADALMADRVENDPVRIAAMCAPTINEWIPVTERSPEEQDEYLVTWKYDYDCRNRCFVGIFEFTFDDGFIPDLSLPKKKNIEVIAWMPLPDPHKEVEE